jgi:hypothetical protein
MTPGLLKTLSYTDLLGIGIASILGSGGFNLIGKAVNRSGKGFYLALGAVGALFFGASRVYQKAFEAFPSNTSESEIVRDQMGGPAARFSEAGILLFNILSISTILVFCSKTMFPRGGWYGQIAVALMLLTVMMMLAKQGIEENKQITNLFSVSLIVFLGLLTVAGVFEGATDGFKLPAQNGHNNFPLSVVYFYFIMAGFDALIKFTDEAKDKSDIPKSFYGSNSLAFIVVLGISFAFMHLKNGERMHSEQNAVGLIVEKLLGGGSATTTIVMIASIVYMLVTTFVVFLTTSRFFYGLGEKEGWSWFTRTNDKKAPINTIFLTFLVATAGIVINHVDTLVRLSDIFLTVTMILVSGAVTLKTARAGGVPLVEGATCLGFSGLMAMILNPALRTED